MEAKQGRQIRRQNFKSVVRFAEVSFEGMTRLNVTAARKERVPLLWSTAGETALAEGFLLLYGGHEVQWVQLHSAGSLGVCGL